MCKALAIARVLADAAPYCLHRLVFLLPAAAFAPRLRHDASRRYSRISHWLALTSAGTRHSNRLQALGERDVSSKTEC
jgi:hypothetical protein